MKLQNVLVVVVWLYALASLVSMAGAQYSGETIVVQDAVSPDACPTKGGGYYGYGDPRNVPFYDHRGVPYCTCNPTEPGCIAWPPPWKVEQDKMKGRPQPVARAVQAVQGVVNMLAPGDDALAEVNAARARRGLRPFLPDPALNQAARACAQLRASRRIQGHLSNDFAHVPAGTFARGAGCAAWPPGMGWGACCTYENWTYAGAAWAMGADGQRYMHLFVR